MFEYMVIGFILGVLAEYFLVVLPAMRELSRDLMLYERRQR